MAKKDNKPNIRFGALKRIANLMQSNTDNLYKNTYFSDPSNKQQLIDLKSGIDDTIRDIATNAINTYVTLSTIVLTDDIKMPVISV